MAIASDIWPKTTAPMCGLEHFSSFFHCSKVEPRWKCEAKSTTGNLWSGGPSSYLDIHRTVIAAWMFDSGVTSGCRFTNAARCQCCNSAASFLWLIWFGQSITVWQRPTRIPRSFVVFNGILLLSDLELNWTPVYSLFCSALQEVFFFMNYPRKEVDWCTISRSKNGQSPWPMDFQRFFPDTKKGLDWRLANS